MTNTIDSLKNKIHPVDMQMDPMQIMERVTEGVAIGMQLLPEFEHSGFSKWHTSKNNEKTNKKP